MAFCCFIYPEYRFFVFLACRPFIPPSRGTRRLFGGKGDTVGGANVIVLESKVESSK